jgi:hypothetical protein
MGIGELFGWGKKSGEGPAVSAAETETVRKIIGALDRLDPKEARFIAAFAYILSRVARAVLVISDDETRVMERLVQEKSGLPEAQSVLVVQIAKTQAILFGGVENFLVTREFESIAGHEQKIALLHCLYAVAGTARSPRPRTRRSAPSRASFISIIPSSSR